jgi:tetratricopeptide (TPR) repeat protein
MKQHTIKVFPKTAGVTLLRFLSPEGKLIGERELDPFEVDRFVIEVDHKYSVVSVSSTTMVLLGRELYEWLDGPAHRWLSGAMNNSNGMTLRIDVDGRLRHLPWELLYTGGAYLCSNDQQPFTPARLVTERRQQVERHNRPLRLLFMACSAENVQPMLDFESEERMILQSALRYQIDLLVEESGSLDGLRYQIEAFGTGYFDVFHLTGHADARGDRPCFLMEDNQGFRQEVSAQEIAEAFQGNWPRLVFISGCRTGQAPDHGHLPSFCEALVKAGAPAVIGWALPVGDVSASLAAAELYRNLAAGKPIDEAVARARLHLLKEKSAFWHLLRLYVDDTSVEGMVTLPKTPKRERLQVREAASEFFDAGAKVEVCKREAFVGRRRPIQRCLRALQSRQGDEHYAEGVLLHGMGGLGKSSLAVRLCERLQGYKRMVFVGAIGNMDLDFTGKISDALGDPEAIELLNQPGLNLTQRLRNLLLGPMGTQSLIFVFDDFEQNLEAAGDGYVVKPAALEVLKSLMTAIRETNSESRVILTSRYMFPLPHPLILHEEGLESLKGAELNKKLSRLKRLRPGSSIEEKIRERAIELGAGNPRLLEWFDRILTDGAADAAAIMDAMDREAERFRESVLLRALLAQLPQECRRLIALASVYELPVNRQAIAAAAGGSLDPHLTRSISLGLIESGTDLATGDSRFFVSRVILPLVEPEAAMDERMGAVRRAANHLYQARWRSGAVIGPEEALEIFRLAMAAKESEIAAVIGNYIASRWINGSRFREAELLCSTALGLSEDYRLILPLARAQAALGSSSEALQNYERALSLCPESDLNNKSSILFNLAALAAKQGLGDRALGLWEQSLDLDEQIGDLQGKVTTLHQMAYVIAQQGDVGRALDLWQQSLSILEEIGDVHGKAAALNNMAEVITQQGDVNRAMEMYLQSLALKEQIGDVQGTAATLNNMAGVIAQQGDVGRALEMYQRSLNLYLQIKDAYGTAAAMHQMARVIAQQGDVELALEMWQKSLAIKEKTGDAKGKAATMHEMAGIIAQRGDVERALEMWQESLRIEERIGDVKGKANTLHQMATVTAQQGDHTRALEMWRQSLELREQIGDIQGKALALSQMAWLAWEQGNTNEARRLYLDAANLLASVRAWIDLAGALSNLGVNSEDGIVYLAQALWLALRVDVPVKESIMFTIGILMKVGVEADISPLLGTVVVYFVGTRGRLHPERVDLQRRGINMLIACAAARNIKEQSLFDQWMVSEGLHDRNRYLPALSSALEAMVGEDEWLFDRQLVGPLR